MALIPCKECQKEISSEAAACPNCGAKVTKPKKKSSLTPILWIAGAGAIGLVALTTPKQNAEPPPKSAEQIAADKKRDAQLQTAAAGTIALKKAMKDPEAFDLKSLFVTNKGFGCVEYRAKNSFGAILPGKAVVTPKGPVLTHEAHRNKFVDTWNSECVKADGTDITSFVKRQGII